MEQLPKEIMGTIAAWLSVNTIMSLAATNNRFRVFITANVDLWKLQYSKKYSLETEAEAAWLATFQSRLLLSANELQDARYLLNGSLPAPSNINWYKAYLYRNRTEFNWKYGQYREHIQQLPSLTQHYRYRLLGKSDWGALLMSEKDRRLFLVDAHQPPYWRELAMATLADCTSYPEKAIVSSNYVVVCGRIVYSHPAVRQKRSKQQGLLLDRRLFNRSTAEETTLQDTLRTWMACVWVWHRDSGELLTTIHSPNSLQLQQLVGRWLLVRLCYPSDDPDCGNSRYRVMDLSASTWCTGELIAATGFCHLHVSLEEAAIKCRNQNNTTVAVFVGFETKTHGLTSAFRWQLFSIGRKTPHLLTSGYCPYWPMLVRRKGTSTRLDDQRVLLTVDFNRRTAAQTYVGVLRFGVEKLQWREPMDDAIVTCIPNKNRLLTRRTDTGAGMRHYSVRQLGQSAVLSEYSLQEQYRFQCLSDTLAYAYSPKTADSFTLDPVTGHTIHSMDPSGLTQHQLSLPTLSLLVLLHPQSGQLIICDFVPIL
ncbi:hypothetical protein BDF19DRAFT_443442 [Syncephalis fuscata]|nr:hypothetical protein BDF19DRAFT_443442 [Syncephalis fuscata]